MKPGQEDTIHQLTGDRALACCPLVLFFLLLLLLPVLFVSTWLAGLGALFVSLFLPVVLVAFVGMLCGGAAGCLAGVLIKRKAIGFIAGLLLGPVALALYLDRESAIAWGLHGAWMGAAVGVLLMLCCLAAVWYKQRFAEQRNTPSV